VFESMRRSFDRSSIVLYKTVHTVCHLSKCFAAHTAVREDARACFATGSSCHDALVRPAAAAAGTSKRPPNLLPGGHEETGSVCSYRVVQTKKLEPDRVHLGPLSICEQVLRGNQTHC
jgi:hypothetical protein